MSSFSGSESRLDDRVAQLERSVRTLDQSVIQIRLDHALTRSAFFDFVWKSFAGVDFSQARIQRFIPVRIYIDDKSSDFGLTYERRQLMEALFTFLSTSDFYFSFELPETRGSIRQYLGAVSEWWGSEKDGKRRLKELEEAAKTVMLDKPKAETEKLRAETAKIEAETAKIEAETQRIEAEKAKVQAETAAVLLDRAKNFDGAVIQFGDKLLISRTNEQGKQVVAVGTLTPSALATLEENLLEGLKPTNASRLLEQDADVAVVEKDELLQRLPLYEREPFS
jgi:hypothetical protein